MPSLTRTSDSVADSWALCLTHLPPLLEVSRLASLLTLGYGWAALRRFLQL